MKDEIIDYLANHMVWKQGSLSKMDMRYEIPRRIECDIVKIRQMISFLRNLPLIEAKHKSTGLFDDNNSPIFVGDTLKSNYGYEVVVSEIGGEFLGKLVCDDNHTCKDIPYALNKGKGYIKVNYFRL